jgi:hypothetical protein
MGGIVSGILAMTVGLVLLVRHSVYLLRGFVDGAGCSTMKVHRRVIASYARSGSMNKKERGKQVDVR